MDAPILKQCSKCHAVKPVEMFKRSPYWCNDCFKAYQLAYRQRPGAKERKRAHDRAYQHARYQRPEVKERIRAYQQRPEVKERMRAYQQRPEVKERKSAYRQRPEVKERMRAYQQRPEVKERRRAYRQRPEVKEYVRIYNRNWESGKIVTQKTRALFSLINLSSKLNEIKTNEHTNQNTNNS